MQMIKPITVPRVAMVVALAGSVLVGCGNSGSKAKSVTPTAAAVPAAGAATMVSYSGSDKILAFDAASKRVTINLIAGEGSAGNGFNFNGYANGDMSIQVPIGWRVKVRAAFPGSAAADFRSGIEKGDDPQTFSFIASRAGEYAIVCGVPGHIDAGMWDALEVVDTLSAPQVLVK